MYSSSSERTITPSRTGIRQQGDTHVSSRHARRRKRPAGRPPRPRTAAPSSRFLGKTACFRRILSQRPATRIDRSSNDRSLIVQMAEALASFRLAVVASGSPPLPAHHEKYLGSNNCCATALARCASQRCGPSFQKVRTISSSFLCLPSTNLVPKGRPKGSGPGLP